MVEGGLVELQKLPTLLYRWFKKAKVDTLILKPEWIVKCQNCGHDCHCGEKCKQEYTDGDGERYEIECCKRCRHKEV